jgi:hypothetical protein
MTIGEIGETNCRSNFVIIFYHCSVCFRAKKSSRWRLWHEMQKHGIGGSFRANMIELSDATISIEIVLKF